MYDYGGSLLVRENGRYTVVGVASWKARDWCPQDVPYVYARVATRKKWIKENTNGTQDSNCTITTAENPAATTNSREDPNNSDKDIIPIDFIVGVSAAVILVIATAIVAVCCWKKNKCSRETEVMEGNPDYGDDYYDKDNYNTRVLDDCNYYGDAAPSIE